MLGSAWLLPMVTSWKSVAYFAGSAASLYKVGLIWPRPWPAIWSAIATMPENSGDEQDVPPTMNQPPAPGAVSYTSGPVRALAWNPTSGTPRMPVFAVVDPAGSVP